MIKIGKLWGNPRFASIPSQSKLLYLYLITQPNISTLGVIEINAEDTARYLGFVDKESMEAYGAYLRTYQFIDRWFTDGQVDTIIIKDHYRSLAKSKSNIRKAIDEGKSSRHIKHLRELYEAEDFAYNDFVPPTADEVTKYALSLGHEIKGREFVEYYGDNDWYDKNNKKVRNWKAKVKKVWCREENKLESVPGAPKGFEYFYAALDNGDRVYPEGWKRGIPTHRNHIYTQVLRDEFNKCTKQQEIT